MTMLYFSNLIQDLSNSLGVLIAFQAVNDLGWRMES